MIAFSLTQIAATYRAAVWAAMYRIDLYKTGGFSQSLFFF